MKRETNCTPIDIRPVAGGLFSRNGLEPKTLDRNRVFFWSSGRASLEVGSPIPIALSAPTVRVCGAAGLALVTLGHEELFEVFTHPERICGSSPGPLARATATKEIFLPKPRG